MIIKCLLLNKKQRQMDSGNFGKWNGTKFYNLSEKLFQVFFSPAWIDTGDFSPVCSLCK